MNRNRNLVIDFQVNHKHDHYIGDEKHVQPSFVVHGVKNGEGTMKATKKKRKFQFPLLKIIFQPTRGEKNEKD